MGHPIDHQAPMLLFDMFPTRITVAVGIKSLPTICVGMVRVVGDVAERLGLCELLRISWEESWRRELAAPVRVPIGT